ncbi:hypothetical protein ITP53_26030 [Nonomuraea sp. K274]|uniref:Uncharacterized protein n=1 Tax=Nonomuraea cypriaca TaxID=1187855 RepID=A0A931F2X8_9ACTN|nr:hypothetical protein [Nonomuraea cypriaca]MBF8189128.1 hypothetical protein [Nonomuraea cypriaca]
MTYRADDLAPLFKAVGDKADIGFHQGRVMAWNQATSMNTISMAGGVLTDVPVLNGTEPLLLKEGDVVGMLRFKTSYFVLGRIVIPGQSEVGTLPGVNQGVGITEIMFDLRIDPAPVATAVFQVPVWANQALVMCTANATIFNSSTDHRFVYLAATVSGGYGGEMYTSLNSGEYGPVSAATQYLLGAESYDEFLEGELPLGSTITVAAEMRANNTIVGNSGNIASVHATAIFRRV